MFNIETDKVQYTQYKSLEKLLEEGNCNKRQSCVIDFFPMSFRQTQHIGELKKEADGDFFFLLIFTIKVI